MVLYIGRIFFLCVLKVKYVGMTTKSLQTARKKFQCNLFLGYFSTMVLLVHDSTHSGKVVGVLVSLTFFTQ